MKYLIESVRKYPCLWKTDIEEYKLNVIKEAAWREIVKECHLSNVKEAKNVWRKLRDGHRQAISRVRKTKNLWKFEKDMEFLLPTMQNRSRSINVDRQECGNQEDSNITSLHNEDSSESDQNLTVDVNIFPEKPNLALIKQQEQRRQETRSDERFSLDKQILYPSTTSKNTSPNIAINKALETFFTSMLITTNSLSETLQLRVQRQLFHIVMEAKEEDIVITHSITSPGKSSSE